MSRAFLESFFPTVTTLCRRFAPTLVERYFPDESASLCPEVAIVRMGYTIRNPVLAVGAVVGILIGGVGMVSARSWIFKTTRQQHRSFLIGFAFFGLMNVTALPLHSFLPATQLAMPEAYPLWWALDCLFTGWSASVLAFGCFDIHLRRHYTIQQADAATKFVPYVGWIALAMLATLAILQLLWFHETYALELFYLIPIAVGASALGPLLLQSLGGVLRQNAADDAARGWSTIRIVGCSVACGGGVLVVMLGILLDATACRVLGQQWGDAFMAATTTFWGCDLVFVAMLFWLPYIMTGPEESESTSLEKFRQQKLKKTR